MPGFFISYRRSDNPDAVGRIYDRLIAEFGKSQVFKDVDSIPLGQDFRAHLNGVVGDCAAVLAIIGPRWTDVRNEAGQKRLDDPDDFVRIELEAALARNVPVVPVLVGHAQIPAAAQLPASLVSLAYRQAIEVRPDPDFHHDATRLVQALRFIIDPDAVVEPRTRRSPPWLIGLAATAVVAAIALAVPALRYLHQAPLLETRTQIVTPRTDFPTNFRLSPDGTMIAFVAVDEGVSRLWVQSLDSTDARSLPGTENARSPFWSPDSRSIGYFLRDGLMRVDLAGGQPQRLADANADARGSWASGDNILFGLNGVCLHTTGKGEAAVPVRPWGDKGGACGTPSFLPDGQRFLFFGGSAPEDVGLYLGSLQGGTPRRLTEERGAFAFLPSGWLLRVRASGALVAQRLDVAKGALIGEERVIADSVAMVSVSGTGRVAYRVADPAQRRLVWVSRSDGAVLETIGDPDSTYSAPRVSPVDGKIAVSREVQGKRRIWIIDNQRSSPVTSTDADEFSVFSPDGRDLAYLYRTARGSTLYRQAASGTEGRVTLAESLEAYPTSWSSDYLLYAVPVPNAGMDMWLQPLTGGQHGKPFPFLQTKATEVWGQLSRDGKWIAYHSNRSGINEVYVRRLVVIETAAGSRVADTEEKIVSSKGGTFPTWCRNGQSVELCYLDQASAMVSVPIKLGEQDAVPGTPVPLFPTQVVGGGLPFSQGRQYDVARDGTKFLINRAADTAVPITLILNWDPEAQKPSASK